MQQFPLTTLTLLSSARVTFIQVLIICCGLCSDGISVRPLGLPRLTDAQFEYVDLGDTPSVTA